MIRVFVEAIGILGPGLQGWNESRRTLAGQTAYVADPFTPPPVGQLPPAERRRAGPAIRLAIAAGTEALAQAERDPATMPMVFTSSNGDCDTVHDILCVLGTERREVSPTRFHNSVHNAPAGYWAVATGSRETSTSLCAFDDSFSAGLLDAAVQTTVERRAVALVAYDVSYPEPLHAVRSIDALFAASFVLIPESTNRTIAMLCLENSATIEVATSMSDPGLERLRLNNPAARSLTLLAAIARREASTINIRSDLGTGVTIAVEPT